MSHVFVECYFLGTNFKPQKVIYLGMEGVVIVIMCLVVVAWMEKYNLVAH